MGLGDFKKAWGTIEQIEAGTFRTTIVDVLVDERGISRSRGRECFGAKGMRSVCCMCSVGGVKG